MANFKTANFNPFTEILNTTAQQRLASLGGAIGISTLLLLLTLLVRIKVPAEPPKETAVLELPMDMVPPEVQKELQELADAEAAMHDEGASGTNDNNPNDGSDQIGGGAGQVIHNEAEENLPPTNPPNTKVGGGKGLSDLLKNKGTKKSGQGTGTSGDGTASGDWGKGPGGGGTGDAPIKGRGKAVNAGAAGYAFTCNTSNLKNAPRGTYKIEVEVDCNMSKTYIGYRGGTAQDDPAAGKSVAKTVQAFLSCATITKNSASVCPQKVIVTFTVEY